MYPFSCSHINMPTVVAKPQEKTTAATVSEERRDVLKRSHGAIHRIQKRDGNFAIFQCARLVSKVRINKSCTCIIISNTNVTGDLSLKTEHV